MHIVLYKYRNFLLIPMYKFIDQRKIVTPNNIYIIDGQTANTKLNTTVFIRFKSLTNN